MRPGLRGLTIGFVGAFLVATAGTGVASYRLALGTIERLADLQARGVLTAEEFQAKKAELLARL